MTSSEAEDRSYQPPLVSVVMCTYNGERYLREQMDSILQQTYRNIELIVCDDASNDQTVSIIGEYQAKDPRIRLFVNEKNLGYNKNFEKAFLLAKGPYIAPSDQDDIWELKKIEIMMNEWPDRCHFVYSLSGNFWGNDFAGRKEAAKVYYSDINDTHKLVFNSPVHGHACMFDKELLSSCLPFPEDIFFDWWISMHAASLNWIGCIPKTLTWHRVHDRNSSRTITSITDKEEREKKLRLQSAYFIESFFRKGIGREDEEQSLLRYASLLRSMNGKNYNRDMFRYIMDHRKLVFHYKKKPFVYFSHLKRAKKMAVTGLL